MGIGNLRHLAVDFKQRGADVHCHIHGGAHRADDDGGKDDALQVDGIGFVEQRNIHRFVVEVAGQLHQLVHDDRQDAGDGDPSGTAQRRCQAFFARSADQRKGHGDDEQAGDDRDGIGVVACQNGRDKDDKNCQTGQHQREDGH